MANLITHGIYILEIREGGLIEIKLPDGTELKQVKGKPLIIEQGLGELTVVTLSIYCKPLNKK